MQSSAFGAHPSIRPHILLANFMKPCFGAGGSQLEKDQVSKEAQESQLITNILASSTYI